MAKVNSFSTGLDISTKKKKSQIIYTWDILKIYTIVLQVKEAGINGRDIFFSSKSFLDFFKFIMPNSMNSRSDCGHFGYIYKCFAYSATYLGRERKRNEKPSKQTDRIRQTDQAETKAMGQTVGQIRQTFIHSDGQTIR